jgi:hypothetical protein
MLTAILATRAVLDRAARAPGRIAK